MTREAQPGSPSPPSKKTHTVRRILAATAWVFGALVCVLVVVVLVLVSLVNVDSVHEYLLGLAQREASSMLGAPVTLENFSVEIPALRIDLYGLTVAGATPYRTPPLLQVDRIAASARIVSLFRMKWYLNRVEIDHPVVWILENKDGRSNLPSLNGGAGKSRVSLFSLAIRHAIVSRGEIYLNDRPQSLDGSLKDLKMNAEYNPQRQEYAGSLGYRDGQIQFGKLRPVSHTLDATFEYAAAGFRLNRATISSGNSKAVISGNVKSFSQPEIRAQYDLMIDGKQARRILRDPWVPSGLLEVKGSVTYAGAASGPPLERMTLNGEATSRALTLTTQKHALSLENVVARYSASQGTLTLQDFRADVLGGDIALKGTETTGNRQGGSAKAELHGISLGDAEKDLQIATLKPVALKGTLNASATASWGASFKSLEATINASTASEMMRRPHRRWRKAPSGSTSRIEGSNDNSGVPIQVQLHAVYTRRNNRILLSNTLFQTQNTSLGINGTVGRHSSLAMILRANNLAEVESFSSLFVTQRSAERLRSLGISGEASFQGTVIGSITSPQISGYLEGSHLTVNGSRWNTFHANVAVSPSFVRIDRAYLAPAGQGEIHVSANAGLDHWSFSQNSPIRASLNLSMIKTSVLTQAVKETIPVKGTLNAAIQLHGSVEEPSGNGRIQFTKAIAYKQPIKSALISFSTSGDEIHGQGIVEIAGGMVKASATVNPVQRTYSGQLGSAGVRIGHLEYVSGSNIKAAGILQVDADGHGSFDNPQMNVKVQIPKASIEGRDFSGINLQINLANRAISARLSSMVANAPIEARAKISLTGSYPASLSLDTQTISVQPLLALYSPDVADQITGQTQVHAELHGPLKNRQAINGDVTIPMLKISYNKVATLAATEPIRIEYRSGILHLQPAAIKGTDTDLKLQGAVPIFSKTPMSLQVQGSVNLEIAQILYPSLRASGVARINIQSGSASTARMGGQIDIVNASLSSSSFPVGLQNGNGVLTVSSNRIDISKFTGTIGGGSIAAQGGVSLRPNLGFDLGLAATNVRILYPQGMRESLDANLRLSGSTQRALLGGSVGISDVSFSPGFDLMSMIGQFSSGVSTPTAPGFSQNLALNVTVHSTNTLSPTSKTMNVAGTAALSVRGTAAHPALIGRINLTGGSMIFHGDRFVLTSGTVQFVNPNEIRPVLNVSLTTTIQQYDIDLRFSGPADQMHFEYTSTPSLPQADIISLLAFGTTTETQAANPTPTNQAAESLIAAGVSSQVTSRISRIAGISQLSISPVLTSGTAAGPPGAVITIQQQVTGNLFITFSTNVASTQDETIQGEYRLSPRVSLSATRDPNGGFAVDALIKKSW
jgi:translocation and assembly module TamB